MTEDEDEGYELDDGREVGEWDSRYPRRAWMQILPEFFLLFSYLLVSGYLILDAIIEPQASLVREGYVYSSLLGAHVDESNSKWIALGLAGFIGGAVFDLKWLYHSVAKGIWNRDRCLWRIIVPFNSAMVSTFTGFLFVSGIFPFLEGRSFENIWGLSP